MKLEFVEDLPKQGTGRRVNSMRLDVLEELADILAGEAGQWAKYPWKEVRPDLVDCELGDKKVISHIRTVQHMCKYSEAPFNVYLVELVVRKQEPYIRVVLPTK